MKEYLNFLKLAQNFFEYIKKKIRMNIGLPRPRVLADTNTRNKNVQEWNGHLELWLLFLACVYTPLHLPSAVYLLNNIINSEVTLWIWDGLKLCLCKNCRREKCGHLLGIVLWTHQVCSFYSNKRVLLFPFFNGYPCPTGEDLGSIPWSSSWLQLPTVCPLQTSRWRDQ